METEDVVQASRLLQAEGVTSATVVTAILTSEPIRRDLRVG
ncbi:MAG: hypothetical protein QF435_03075 [Arenicellales bacterium]|nr:hypothetical protein [Arenicellales bacterium]